MLTAGGSGSGGLRARGRLRSHVSAMPVLPFSGPGQRHLPDPSLRPGQGSYYRAAALHAGRSRRGPAHHGSGIRSCAGGRQDRRTRLTGLSRAAAVRIQGGNRNEVLHGMRRSRPQPAVLHALRRGVKSPARPGRRPVPDHHRSRPARSRPGPGRPGTIGGPAATEPAASLAVAGGRIGAASQLAASRARPGQDGTGSRSSLRHRAVPRRAAGPGTRADLAGGRDCRAPGGGRCGRRVVLSQPPEPSGRPGWPRRRPARRSSSSTCPRATTPRPSPARLSSRPGPPGPGRGRPGRRGYGCRGRAGWRRSPRLRPRPA